MFCWGGLVPLLRQEVPKKHNHMFDSRHRRIQASVWAAAHNLCVSRRSTLAEEQQCTRSSNACVPVLRVRSSPILSSCAALLGTHSLLLYAGGAPGGRV